VAKLRMRGVSRTWTMPMAKFEMPKRIRRLSRPGRAFT
jgi:hypothetical protein